MFPPGALFEQFISLVLSQQNSASTTTSPNPTPKSPKKRKREADGDLSSPEHESLAVVAKWVGDSPHSTLSYLKLKLTSGKDLSTNVSGKAVPNVTKA